MNGRNADERHPYPLFHSLMNGHVCLVVSLEDVEEEVLDAFDGGADLHIDVGLVLEAESLVVRDDTPVV
jgi:hypothetical protein